MNTREILFRAKRVDSSKWIEGYYVKYESHLNCDCYYGIVPTDAGGLYAVRINPETLCQYTRLKDKNGNRIWENDIIKHKISDTIGTVKWYQEDYVGWCVNDIVIDEQQFTDEMWCECEVIGNIFDNPELLKGVD